MAIQPNTATIAINQKNLYSDKNITKPSRSGAGVLRIVGFIWVCFTLSIAIIYFAAHTTPPPKVIEPPPQLLPGNELSAVMYCKTAPDGHCYPPLNTHCNIPGDGRCLGYPSYYVESIGKTVYLTVEITSGLITETLIPSKQNTIGDLITIWGTPLGINQSGRIIVVYWNTRSAFMSACSFRPKSHIEWVTYFTTPPPVPPWRGFRNSIQKNC